MCKNRKNRAAVAAILLALLMLLSACGPKGGKNNAANNTGAGSKDGKDPYGFVSNFQDETKEELKLKNRPEMKDDLLALEKALLDRGITIDRIFYNGSMAFAKFFIGSKVEEDIFKADDYISLQYRQDKDTQAFYIYEIEAYLYNTEKYDTVRDAIVSVMGFDELEIKAFKELDVSEDVQTAKYMVGHYNGRWEIQPDMTGIKTESYEEYEKIASQKRSFPYEKFNVYYHPAENERQTVLYKAQREERKPKAEGRNIDEFNLSFNIPEAMKTNPYSGMLAVWEYYTGEYDGSGYANGIDLGMMVTNLKGMSLDTYVRTESKPAKSSGVTPFEIKKINGVDWYTCNNGRFYYYAAEFNGHVYEFEIRYTSVVDGVTLEYTLDLLERTLFFE